LVSKHIEKLVDYILDIMTYWIFYINKMPKKAKEMDYIFLLRRLKSVPWNPSLS